MPRLTAGAVLAGAAWLPQAGPGHCLCRQCRHHRPMARPGLSSPRLFIVSGCVAVVREAQHCEELSQLTPGTRQISHLERDPVLGSSARRSVQPWPPPSDHLTVIAETQDNQ